MPDPHMEPARASAPVNPLQEAVLTDDPDEVARLDVLGSGFREALVSMYRGEPQADSTGAPREIDETTRISVDEGLVLYRLAVDRGFTSLLEVGLGYGFSTVYLLAALERNGGGQHTVIDAYQDRDWHGIGRATAQRLVAGAGTLTPQSFTLIEGRSFPALGRLIAEERTFELAFIDGYHRFDDVLVDFTLSARMCPIGGVIVLHDMWLDSIAAVASFLRANRPDFEEIVTGCENLFAVRRIDRDRRDWRHFSPFAMR